MSTTWRARPTGSAHRSRWSGAIGWLPRGGALPQEMWASRHRCVVVILGGQTLAIPAYAVFRGHSVRQGLIEAALPAGLAALACLPFLPNRLRAALAAVGLMVVSAIVVLLSGGAVEAHFHYFAMIPVAALYQDWVPFGVAIGYVLFQHGIVGTLHPHDVYPSNGHHVWISAGVHAGYMAVACLGAVATWRLNERSREVERGLTDTLEHRVHHDALTGLPNRTLFLERLDEALRIWTERGGAPTVLLLDLDGFKDVNDTYGHHCGDILLVEVADRLVGCVRDVDTVTRLSGDEFAVLLVPTGVVLGEDVAEAITTALSAPFRLETMEVELEVSIGIAGGEPGDDAKALVRKADSAMYVAKRQRSGRTRYEPDHSDNTTTRLALLGALRRALQTDEIVLHYQPQVSLLEGDLVGVEALARWRHPTRGLLPPGEFIPIVERTSMIHAFTANVLTAALAQTRTWQDRGLRLPVSVNVSTRCLLDMNLVELVESRLRRAGVAGELLCLEITEDTVMADPDRAIDTLRRIRALGVRVSLDDYGTGYSSLAYLRVLPVDELKVDRSFVESLGSGERHEAVLVRSVVALGHDLGLTVVAEGVEDERCLSELRRLGCDVAQGYHLARPMTPASLEVWMSRGCPAPLTSQGPGRGGPAAVPL